MPDNSCDHAVLGFTTGGLYVTCFGCGQLWIAVKPSEIDDLRYCSPIIDQDASRHGLTLADVRSVPNPLSKIYPREVND